MRRPLGGGGAVLGAIVLSSAALAGPPKPPTPPFAPPPPSSSAAPNDASRRGEVTISTAEYRALVESAGPPSAAAAAGVRVENARFRVAVTKETASFEERFDVHVSGTGWLSLPIVRTALDRVSLAPAERGAFFVARDVTRLALNGPGSATATLGTTAPVAVDANGRRLFSLTMPLLAVQQGKIELPGSPGLEVTVTGGELLARDEQKQKGSTILDVAVRPGAVLTVAFREPNLSEKGRTAPLRASAVVYSRSDVVGPSIVTDVTVRITATAGRIGGVAFEIPTGQQVLYLRGPGLLAAETSANQVRASRATPSPDPLDAHLRLSRSLAESGSVEIRPPRLVLDGAGPVDVYAELRPPAGVLVELTSTGSFEPVEIDKLPPAVKTLAADSEEVLRLTPNAPALEPAVYKLHRLDAAPILAAQVRSARGHTLVSREGRALSRIEYEVVSSAKPFLTIHLPPGSRFWGAEAMGRPIVPAMPEAGSVAVPLRGGRRRVARVAIYVLSEAVVPKGKGTLEFQPPGTDIPISEMTWSFSLPPNAEYSLEGTDYHAGSLAGAAPVDAGAASWQSELGQRAQEALARETSAAGRTPIAPRMPVLEISAIVRTELPGSVPKPVRFGVKPVSGKGEWL